jgi:hypothetical protein
MAILREGPWQLVQAPDVYSDDERHIETFVGDQHEYEFEARGADGNVLDVTGYSYAGKVFNVATGVVLLNSETVTAGYATGGRLIWKPSTPWANAGTFRFTASLTAAGETIILGPVLIKVQAR